MPTLFHEYRFKHEIETSPWGDVQACDKLAPGFYLVDTASHGGIMVEEARALAELPVEARECGFHEDGYLCFEEDSAAAVPLRELLDRPDWNPLYSYGCSRQMLESSVDKTLANVYPAYAASREKRVKKAKAPSPQKAGRERKSKVPER
ncbi:hypothetical protein LJC61_05190 [Ruminococcaceae bacterium OttesenSCG-928-A16]|nr:hypothetical protein [Ruminococcaceae bacterium OttesenSCG-928-A16]